MVPHPEILLCVPDLHTVPGPDAQLKAASNYLINRTSWPHILMPANPAALAPEFPRLHEARTQLRTFDGIYCAYHVFCMRDTPQRTKFRSTEVQRFNTSLCSSKLCHDLHILISLPLLLLLVRRIWTGDCSQVLHKPPGLLHFLLGGPLRNTAYSTFGYIPMS